MRTIIRGKGEQTALWWHSQCLDRRGRLWKEGRGWLNWAGNHLGLNWVVAPRHGQASITLSDPAIDDDAIVLALSIPFLVALYLSLHKANWVRNLPGVRWRSGNHNSGQREIRLAIHHNALWWTLWVNGNGMRTSSWRDGCFHLDDFLLGRAKYRESDRVRHEATLVLLEGRYPVTVELFTSTWKRKRWPWRTHVERANIEIPNGVPVPGKGENAWDLEDDAVFSATYPASSVEEALTTLCESVIRQRKRHGGAHWSPTAGWPAHCQKDAAG